MAYNLNDATKLKHLQTAVTKVKVDYDAKIAETFKAGKVNGNTVEFYTDKDMTGAAAFTFDFPVELVLDQAKTVFVDSFTFSTEAYKDATDPNLEGKPVLVLAVKGSDGSLTYSFLDLERLTDVDLSNYLTKVAGATEGNLAALDANGNVVDSGIGIAEDAEVEEMLNEIFPKE